jgi:hypothetical protein
MLNGIALFVIGLVLFFIGICILHFDKSKYHLKIIKDLLEYYNYNNHFIANLCFTVTVVSFLVIIISKECALFKQVTSNVINSNLIDSGYLGEQVHFIILVFIIGLLYISTILITRTKNLDGDDNEYSRKYTKIISVIFSKEVTEILIPWTGLITAIAGLITAIAGLILALKAK